jgi:hypothetical protein
LNHYLSCQGAIDAWQNYPLAHKTTKHAAEIHGRPNQIPNTVEVDSYDPTVSRPNPNYPPELFGLLRQNSPAFFHRDQPFTLDQQLVEPDDQPVSCALDRDARQSRLALPIPR